MTEEGKRSVPINDLDFNSMLANPEWGNNPSNIELKQKLQSIIVIKDKNGKPLFQEEERIDEKTGKSYKLRNPIAETVSEYENLSFISRDFRLGNITRDERIIVSHWGNLAHDCLQDGLKKSHSAAMSRCAMILEPSQSVNGFVRKIMQSIIQHNISQQEEPPKKKLFGGNKQKQGGYY